MLFLNPQTTLLKGSRLSFDSQFFPTDLQTMDSVAYKHQIVNGYLGFWTLASFAYYYPVNYTKEVLRI